MGVDDLDPLSGLDQGGLAGTGGNGDELLGHDNLLLLF
jgi:hypothetical protein